MCDHSVVSHAICPEATGIKSGLMLAFYMALSGPSKPAIYANRPAQAKAIPFNGCIKDACVLDHGVKSDPSGPGAMADAKLNRRERDSPGVM